MGHLKSMRIPQLVLRYLYSGNQISNLKRHLCQLILEFSLSRSISELVLQLEVRSRFLRGAVQLVFRFPIQDEFNTIHKPHISPHLQSKDCGVALADGNAFPQGRIPPQQSTDRTADAIPKAEAAALIFSETATLYHH